MLVIYLYLDYLATNKLKNNCIFSHIQIMANINEKRNWKYVEQSEYSLACTNPHVTNPIIVVNN